MVVCNILGRYARYFGEIPIDLDMPLYPLSEIAAISGDEWHGKIVFEHWKLRQIGS